MGCPQGCLMSFFHLGMCPLSLCPLVCLSMSTVYMFVISDCAEETDPSLYLLPFFLFHCIRGIRGIHSMKKTF